MRICTFTLIRMSGLIFLMMASLGVVANRLSSGLSENMKVDFGQPWTVSQHVIDPIRGENLILEMGQDTLKRMNAEPESRLDLMSISPFIDRQGNRQMVVRRRKTATVSNRNSPGKIELVRMSYPSGEEIGSREIEWMPNSVAAIDPVTQHGVRSVMGTGAGQLMTVCWTNAKGIETSDTGKLLEWSIAPPFGESTFLSEPSWFADSRFPDHLMVSYWGTGPTDNQFHVGIGWIKLDETRQFITGFGQILDRSAGQLTRKDSLRHPVVRAMPDGSLAMVWLQRNSYQKNWSLWSGILEARGDTSDCGFVMNKEGIQPVVENCMPTPASLDRDGKYVYFVVPETDDCYDGGYWRKNRLNQPELQFAKISPDLRKHRP